MSADRTIPDNWCWATVGEICDADNGRAFKSTEWRESGTPIIRIENLKNSNARFNYFQGDLDDKHRVEHGDVLFAWSGTPGTSFGSHIWGGGAAALNQHIFNIRFDRKSLNAQYLKHALNENVRSYVQQAQGGVGLAHITKSKFMASQIPLVPRSEQERIVAAVDTELSKLAAAVAGLERVQANLKRYRASVLKAAVGGRLVPTEAELAREEGRDYEPGKALLDRILSERRRRWEGAELAKMKAKGKPPKNDKWKAKYKEPAPPESSSLPTLPEGWCWTTVESISSKVVDGVHKKPSYVDSGVPFVTVKNLTAGPGISFESLRYITEEDHEKFVARANPERGDLLVSKDGTLGVVRAIRTDTTFSIFVSVALVKPILGEMTDYLEVALSSPVVQRQMVPKGSGLQHIHLEDLRADCIPVPPLAEWSRICAEVQRHISVLEELEREVAHGLVRCARLRQSVLKWAFEGKLVDQDLNDEPATALLDCIKAKRKLFATSAKTKKRGRRKARSTKA